jgi:hypothetical protein
VLRGETSTYRDACSGLPSLDRIRSGGDGEEQERITTHSGHGNESPQPVVRVVCRVCHSKLLTTTTTTSTTRSMSTTVAAATATEAAGSEETSESFEAAPRQRRRSWINMGPLMEGKGRFPTPLLGLEPRAVGGPPVGWYLARPNKSSREENGEEEEEEDDEANTQDEDTVLETDLPFAHGRCACGQVRYRMLNQHDTELQHCYCRLCRQYSGGPFMTWMPAHYLEWLDGDGRPSRSAEPPLVRTTSHGRRHFCPSCHTCLTIVYDDQPGTIWPVAASLEDSTALGLYRVVHICCRYRPKWYELPNDGLPRVQEAS